MKIAVRYQSRGGNLTEKQREMVVEFVKKVRTELKLEPLE